jgi:regulator of sirC expression with transglutaminase-like and TPR domain
MPHIPPSAVKTLENMAEGLMEVSRQIQDFFSKDADRQNVLQKCLETLKSEHQNYLLKEWDEEEGVASILVDDLQEIDHRDLIKEIEEALAPLPSTGTNWLYNYLLR